jgi:hypothetical protein
VSLAIFQPRRNDLTEELWMMDTTITDLRSRPKRLPSYWFESRRCYFAIMYEIVLAIGIDTGPFPACLI